MRIVLDPGHGGKDPGAVGKVMGIKEKDVVLGIAKLLAEKLRTAGHEVSLTRDSDEYISLEKRVKKFAAIQPDFVLSLHINSALINNADYVSSFLFDTEKKELYNFAAMLTTACSKAMKWPDGGVRKANYYVLRNTQLPVCLIEIGFISNAEQEQELAKANVRDKIANALSAAISPAEDVTVAAVYYNGKQLMSGHLNEGTAYVSVREFAQQLGYELAWDSINNKAYITKNTSFPRKIKEHEVEIIHLTSPVVIGELKNGATIAPVRDLAEMLGYKATWDAQTKTVSIE